MTISDQIREYFEERCAILEFECGLPREKAEALALAECETWRKKIEADKTEEVPNLPD